MNTTLKSLLLLSSLTLPTLANDTLATADLITPNSYYSNYAINPAGDNDYARVVFPSAGDFVIASEGSTDTYGYLLSSSGATLATNDDTVGVNFRIAARVTAGTYYVRMRHFSPSGTGSFAVRSTFTPVVADDHGNTTATATAVSLSGTTTATRAGNIGVAGDIDMFRVVISGTGFLNAGTTGSTDTYGCILNSASSELSANNDANGTANFSLRQAVTSGTYYVKVRHFSSTRTGAYALNLRFEPGSTGGGGGTVTGSKRALVIGISDYRSISDLNLCDDDARAVTTALRNSGWTVTTLIDSQASKAGIQAQIARLAPGGGSFLLYYSGHGSCSGSTGYMCNWDTTGTASTMISEIELDAWLRSAGTTTVGVVFDSCCSGTFIGRYSVAAGNKSRYFPMVGAPAPDARAGEFMARNISVSGRVVLAGCRGSEYSYESPTIGHGWLTYALLQAWRTASYDSNRNSWISLEESFNRVSAGTNSYGGQQTPQLYDGNGAAHLDLTRL